LPALAGRAILGCPCARRFTAPHLFSIEPPLQPISPFRRLAAFALPFALVSALACYQDKPPAARAAPPAGGDAASLGLRPVPATHDTALREVDSFALTPEVLQRWAAAQRNLNTLNARDPDVVTRMKAGGPPGTFTDMTKRLEGEPAVHHALDQAGISSHDYVLTMIALQQALQGFQVKQAGKLDSARVPPVIMGNIAFVESHLQDVMQAMGVSRSAAPPR
jgi:hypothetical protein